MQGKLVRDKAPFVIGKEGRWSKVTLCQSDEEFVVRLKVKLNEEVGEYYAGNDSASDPEELIDVIEVCIALYKEQTGTDIFRPMENKRDEMGKFTDRIVLLDYEGKHEKAQ